MGPHEAEFESLGCFEGWSMLKSRYVTAISARAIEKEDNGYLDYAFDIYQWCCVSYADI